jgi:hypothetical protein
MKDTARAACIILNATGSIVRAWCAATGGKDECVANATESCVHVSAGLHLLVKLSDFRKDLDPDLIDNEVDAVTSFPCGWRKPSNLKKVTESPVSKQPVFSLSFHPLFTSFFL